MYVCIYIIRGYRQPTLILPAISQRNVPYRSRVNCISLRRSRRLIQITLGPYGTVRHDTASNNKIV